MTAINKNTLPDVRADINAALATVAEKHSLSFDIGNIRFTSDSFRCKLEAHAILPTSDTSIIDTEREAFSSMCGYVNLTPDFYGRVFNVGGETFKLCKIKPNNSKYPLIAKKEGSSSLFKFPVDVVR